MRERNKGGSGVDKRIEWIDGRKAQRGERRDANDMTETERRAREKWGSRRTEKAMLTQDAGSGNRNHDNGKWESWVSSRRILMGWCVGTEPSH